MPCNTAFIKKASVVNGVATFDPAQGGGPTVTDSDGNTLSGLDVWVEAIKNTADAAETPVGRTATGGKPAWLTAALEQAVVGGQTEGTVTVTVDENAWPAGTEYVQVGLAVSDGTTESVGYFCYYASDAASPGGAKGLLLTKAGLGVYYAPLPDAGIGAVTRWLDDAAYDNIGKVGWDPGEQRVFFAHYDPASAQFRVSKCDKGGANVQTLYGEAGSSSAYLHMCHWLGERIMVKWSTMLARVGNDDGTALANVETSAGTNDDQVLLRDGNYAVATSGYLVKHNMTGAVLASTADAVHTRLVERPDGRIYARLGAGGQYGIRLYEPDLATYQTIIPELGEGLGLAFNAAEDALYYSVGNSVYRANADGSQPVVAVADAGTTTDWMEVVY